MLKEIFDIEFDISHNNFETLALKDNCFFSDLFAFNDFKEQSKDSSKSFYKFQYLSCEFYNFLNFLIKYQIEDINISIVFNKENNLNKVKTWQSFIYFDGFNFEKISSDIEGAILEKCQENITKIFKLQKELLVEKIINNNSKGDNLLFKLTTENNDVLFKFSDKLFTLIFDKNSCLGKTLVQKLEESSVNIFNKENLSHLFEDKQLFKLEFNLLKLILAEQHHIFYKFLEELFLVAKERKSIKSLEFISFSLSKNQFNVFDEIINEEEKFEFFINKLKENMFVDKIKF